MKRVLPSCSLLLLLLLSFSVGAQAQLQLYKWVGPDGKVTYSDTPPPKSATGVSTPALPAGGVNPSELPFELAEAAKNYPVTLYTTRDCTPCADGRQFLSQRGIPFNEKTVTNNEDVAQLRQVGGDQQLPLLTIGRAKERGFNSAAWNAALSAAGYPETSKLPKNYRSPPAEPAAPVKTVKQESPKESSKVERSAEKPPATAPASELPPAVGNAPPGFRF